MESQKQISASQQQMMMSLIQDEVAFNDSNHVENYGGSEPSLLSSHAGFGGLFETATNYSVSVNTSIFFPDSPGATPSSDEAYVPYSLRPETYIIPVLFAIIFVIGVIGNGTLIVIFLKHRSMRNVPNMSIWTSVGGRYICSLAVGDILVIFFCVPFTSTVYTVESWPYGVIVCKFSEFIKDLSIGVSVFTLTALSADRYFAIVDPMRKLTGRRANRVTCITIIGIWLISILFALPSLIFSFIWTVEDKSSNHTYDVCYPFPQELTEAYPKVVVMFKFLVYYAIPLCFIATFYIIMAHHLLQSTRNMPGEAQGQTKQIQSRKKVAKMVLSFVVIFALCFFPSHVFLIWFYYYPDATEHYNLFWHWVRMVGFCTSFINSCINPITLYCVSGTFRKHFNRHLFCCCREHRRSHHRHHHNHFIRGAASGYGNVSMSHTDHIYADRIKNGTQISRASTLNNALAIPRSRQNSQQLHPFGNNVNMNLNNGNGRSPLPSPNGNGNGKGFEGGIEMTTRNLSEKQRFLCTEDSAKFELIQTQQHFANNGSSVVLRCGGGGDEEEGKALLVDTSLSTTGNGTHHNHVGVASSCI
ncbi:unnamed protein product [Orchesella dallaii]|uniref:G-protein coupled receptors family 1 profile domain-containing protein n=1 Tax=Orchesella dallaii TaxID=48710 RepID=A0ABP1R4D7_9HEXA